MVDGKSNRWVVRYYDNKQRPSVVFPTELTEEDAATIHRNGLEISGSQVIIDVPENILRLSWMVRDAYAFCCDDENFKRKRES